MAEGVLESLISSNHRRVISVRVRLLEEYCLHLIELFRPFESTFTSRTQLPQEKAEVIRQGIAAFRSKIGKINTDLGLEHAYRNAKQEAAALVITMLTTVEELHPHHLKGYGEVPQPLNDYLVERLKDLLQTLETLDRILMEKTWQSSAKNSSLPGSSLEVVFHLPGTLPKIYAHD